ncbi:hypothetical protein CANINC_000414, partial [Pichia inconspicua]
VGTTSCTVPSGISGSFAETVSTVTRSGTIVTVSNGIVPSFSCEPSTTTTTFTVCKSSTISAPCTISRNLVEVGTATVVLSDTICKMPDGIAGSFARSTTSTTYSDDVTSTTFIVTNINDPVVECKISSAFESSLLSSYTVPSKPTLVSSSKISLTYSSSSSLLQTSSLSSVSQPPSTISSLSQLPSTSSSLSQLSSAFSSQTQPPPTYSSLSSSSFTAATSSFQLSSVPSNPPVITRTTVNTVCEFTTTTVSSDSTVLEEVVLTPANSCMTFFTTTTLTEINNEDCALKTMTSSNTVVGNDEITTVEVSIVEITPKPECFEISTITTVANSVCSLETDVWTSTVQENNVTVTIIDKTIKTPPATCDIFYTEYPATDCRITTETSFIATTDWEGKYVNGTLIIVETPDESLCALTTKSEFSPTSETQTGGSTIHTTSYTIVTITSCSDNHCHISEIPAPTKTTTTTKIHTALEPTESASLVTVSYTGGIPEPESSIIVSSPDAESETTATATTLQPAIKPSQSTTDHPGNEPSKSTTTVATLSLPSKITESTSKHPDVPIFGTNFEGGAPVGNVSFMNAIFAFLLSALIF